MCVVGKLFVQFMLDASLGYILIVYEPTCELSFICEHDRTHLGSFSFSKLDHIQEGRSRRDFRLKMKQKHVLKEDTAHSKGQVEARLMVADSCDHGC